MIYKYMPSDRIDVLRDLKIRFSPFESLNDPFEALPLFYSQDIDNVTNMLTGEFEKGLLKNNKNTGYTDFVKNAVSVLDQKIRTGPFSPSYFGKSQMQKINEIYPQLGILSLSRVNTSLLMWSHYAENGKGFVLGLDPKNYFFDEINKIGKTVPVVYSQKRFVFDINEHNIKNVRNIPIIFSRKPLAWAYEEEERIFKLLDTTNIDTDTGEKDKFEKKIILSPVPHDAIKSIYIGYNTSNTMKNEIKNAIKKNGLQINVYQAKICDNDYNVFFDEIDISDIPGPPT